MRYLPLLFLALWSTACNATALVSTSGGVLYPPINTAAPLVTLDPLGINLEGINYFTTEMPFINLLHQAGSSANYTAGWYTATGVTFDTAEEAYLAGVLDTNGYPTTLTVAGIPGGQVFTKVTTLINYNLPAAAPGASTTYPAGQYRLKYEGQGTVQITNDASIVGGDTCGAGVTLSNASSNTYVSCTFHVVTPSASTGMILGITAITNNTDYPRDISVVLQSNAAAYDAGAIFNPSLLAMLAPFSSIRFMDWKNTNGEFFGYTANASLSAGATGLTLSSAWLLPTGTYPIMFIDGEQKNASFTTASTAVTWIGGLANSISSTCSGGTWTWTNRCYFQTFWRITHSWANRSKPANAFWDQADGVPLEVAVSLCNALNTNCHLNVPMMYSDADIQAMGQLVMSGTGMQGGFLGLSGTLTSTFELSNEVWNCFNFNQCLAADSLGGVVWPGQPPGSQNYTWNRNWFGMRVAQMASDLQTAVGTTIFARVLPTLGAQSGVTSSASDSLSCAYYVSAPCTAFPIKAIAVAPYWGGNPTSGNCTTMTGVTTPLDDFFATMTSQTGTAGNGSQNYSASVPSGGWMGQVQSDINTMTTLISGTYPSLKLIAYEGGNNFFACFNSGGPCNAAATCAGWPALVTSAERDARMGTTYVTMLNYWKTHAGALSANIFNVYDDVNFIGANGAFGMLESIMQPVLPLISAPAKYNGVVTYIQ